MASNAAKYGELATIFDKSTEADCSSTERVFEAAWKKAKGTAERPHEVARGLPWDYFTGEEQLESARVWLTRLLKEECVGDSCDLNSNLLRGPPECSQFIDRFLPGAVNTHPWDGHPTAAELWNETSHDFCDEPFPHVELARAHPGDSADDDASASNGGVEISESSADGYRKGKYGYSPLTTRAGARLWSIAFAGPAADAGGAPSVEALKAAYPMQLMVRLDSGPRKAIIYDALEFRPTLPATFAADAEHGDPVTPAELGDIERLLKQTKKQRLSFEALTRSMASGRVLENAFLS